MIRELDQIGDGNIGVQQYNKAFQDVMQTLNLDILKEFDEALEEMKQKINNIDRIEKL